MSNFSIPKSYRESKGREIAAAPDQIFEIRRRQLYLVMSQSQTDVAYEVTAMGPYWKCTCRDYRKRGFDCKHIYAVKATLEAEHEISLWESQPRYDPQETPDRIEELMGRPNQSAEEIQTLRILLNTATLPAVSFALRYFWTGFEPAELLDELKGFGLEAPETVEVKTPKTWKWRPLQGTIETVKDYVIESNLRVGLAAVEPYTRTLGRLGDATYHVYLVTQYAA